MRIGFVVHEGRDLALETARLLARWLGERGVPTRSLKAEIGADETSPEEGFADGLDLVVAVGGDGTLLRAAEEAHNADAPVLGVKVGRMGFLVEVEPSEATGMLERILAGEMIVEERTAVEARVEGAGAAAELWALNEIIVEKAARHRLITLAVYIDDEHFTTISGDGLIVAGPTGSTAYSFSVHGPIVSPRLDALILSPVSPHMVFDRPLVIHPGETVTVEVRGEEPGVMSADGRAGPELPVGCRVRLSRAERPARLVRRPDSKSFYRMIREKFDLPGDPRDPREGFGPPGVAPAG